MSATVRAHILAELSFKPREAGGRPVMPVGSGYAPHLRSDSLREVLAVRLNEVPADASFGQAITVRIEGPNVVAEGTCRSTIMGHDP